MSLDLFQMLLFERALYASIAILLTFIVGVITGPLLGNVNPLSWIVFDSLFGEIGQKMDKRARSSKALYLRGLIFTVVLIVFSAAAGYTISYLVQQFPIYGLSQIAFVATLLSSGTIVFAMNGLHNAIAKSIDKKGTFYAIANSTRTDLTQMDDYGATRLSMQFIAMNFHKCLVGPVFWYLIGGFTAAFIYTVIAMLSWRFGKNGFSKGFGRFAMLAELVMGIVPHLIAACLISIAALFTPTGGMTRSFVALLGDNKRARYNEGGGVLTAMTYALDISLGGPMVDIDGSVLKQDWTGSKTATAKLSAEHLKHGIFIYCIAIVLLEISLLALLLVS